MAGASAGGYVRRYGYGTVQRYVQASTGQMMKWVSETETEMETVYGIRKGGGGANEGEGKRREDGRRERGGGKTGGRSYVTGTSKGARTGTARRAWAVTKNAGMGEARALRIQRSLVAVQVARVQLVEVALL